MGTKATTASTADRLFDAQVAWTLARVGGADLDHLIAHDVDVLLEAGRDALVGELARAEDVRRLIRLALERVPAGAAASTLVGIAADRFHDGPPTEVALADLLEREHVEQLLTELFGRADVVGAVLDQVAESPLAASLSARFVTRIVGDVLATNRAVAERIPGVGSLVSLGSSVAGRMVGAADKQIEGLLGDTAGKGAAFAMRRLNKLVVETMKDPAAKAAALQVYDMYADRSLGALRTGSREDAHRVADLVQDIVISGAATEPVGALMDALVDGFFAVYADQPASSLLEDLGLTRDDVVTEARRLVPRILQHAVESGTAERLIRAHLEPFFASAEVASILSE